MAQYYVDHVPRPLRGTGFNPWVMAIVTKKERAGSGGAR